MGQQGGIELQGERMICFCTSMPRRDSGTVASTRGCLPNARRMACPLTYKPDTLTNYEVGWKSTLLDKHLQWNGAFYLMPWKNYQSLLFDPNVCATSSFDANIGNAKIYGSETDIKWAPNSRLSMDVSVELQRLADHHRYLL